MSIWQIVFATVLSLISTEATLAQEIDLGAPYKFLTQEEMAKAQIHPQGVEERGFAMVEADPIFGELSAKLPIFYRFVPVGTASFTTDYPQLDTDSRKVLRDSVPTLVIVNGGPAAASSGHLALEFDYRDRSKNVGLSNRLEILNKYFNVVLVDQRGQGQSIPLAENIEFDYERASKFNNEATVAYDHVSVVEELIRRDLVHADNWYLMGHSYGETPVWQILKLIADGKITTAPKGVVVSAGSIPFDEEIQWKSTRRMQVRYTKQIDDWSKAAGKISFKNLILQTRAKISSLGLNPEAVQLLYYYSVTGQTPGDAYASLEKLLDGLNNASSTTDATKVYNDWVATEGAPGSHQQHMMFIADAGMHFTDLLNKIGRLPPDIVDALAGWEFESTYSPQLLELVRNGKIYKAPTFTKKSAKAFLKQTNIKLVLHSGIDDNVSTYYRVRAKMAASLGAPYVVTKPPEKITTHRAFYSSESTIQETFKHMGLKLKAPMTSAIYHSVSFSHQ